MSELSKETPDDVFRRLSEGKDKRHVRALKAIHAVCSEQRARGSSDFRYTTLGRLMAATRGPTTKSIGNSAPYQTLIAAHREAAQAPQRGKRREREEDPLLDGVRDPGQRARIRDLGTQVGSLKQQVRDLQRIVNRTARVAVDGGTGGVATQTARFVGPAIKPLLPYERDALMRALNPSRLQRVGLAEGRQGEVQAAAGGKELFEAGFASGLRKLLALMDSEAFDGSQIDGSTDLRA